MSSQGSYCCRRGAALLWVLLFTLVGCAGRASYDRASLQEQVPPRVEVTGVPFFPQEVHQCGPAALSMALQWSGLKVTPDSLANEVYTPSRKGSLQMAMIGGARRNGRIAYVISHFDTLFLELSAGHPVIILQNLGLSWYPQWHYAVAVGYDFQEDVVFLRSGRTERLAMALGTLEKTWSRSGYWGLLVLRPEITPAVIQEEPYLKAVLGLEKARQYEAAEEGYETALSLWPRSLGGLIGLGNSRYALGDLEGAEDAFRVAVRYHSDHGAAYNNLAQVLFEQGRREEALEAAKKAVSLGGTMKDVYERTLEEIESK